MMLSEICICECRAKSGWKKLRCQQSVTSIKVNRQNKKTHVLLFFYLSNFAIGAVRFGGVRICRKTYIFRTNKGAMDHFCSLQVQRHTGDVIFGNQQYNLFRRFYEPLTSCSTPCNLRDQGQEAQHVQKKKKKSQLILAPTERDTMLLTVVQCAAYRRKHASSHKSLYSQQRLLERAHCCQANAASNKPQNRLLRWLKAMNREFLAFCTVPLQVYFYVGHLTAEMMIKAWLTCPKYI